MKTIVPAVLISGMAFLVACTGHKQNMTLPAKNHFTGAPGEVRLMILDPGHFHAALLQKTMQKQIDSNVYVFAPAGTDVNEYLSIINGYNHRADAPTHWHETVYTGPDYLAKMLRDKPGNVMVVAGNNAKKTEYIKKTVDAGINVLADKPMVITPGNFPMLRAAFQDAAKNGVLLYDIMTERFEITNILQRELAGIPEVFGSLLKGSADDPAITKESVHHFYKNVSGNPIKRPAWYFDVSQQGEGIADVTTHLVDLVQWAAFPDQALDTSDISMIYARHWSTSLTPEMFNTVTQLQQYPPFLSKYLHGDTLKVLCNGEMTYKIREIYARVRVEWKFEAPQGTGDTHFSIMRGSLCNLMIKQNKEENYLPELYVQATGQKDLVKFGKNLQQAVQGKIGQNYPGVGLKRLKPDLWHVEIPDQYKVGHEAHFAQVAKNYLQYLVDGKLPDWEVPDMITKYYTIMQALKMAEGGE